MIAVSRPDRAMAGLVLVLKLVLVVSGGGCCLLAEEASRQGRERMGPITAKCRTSSKPAQP